jgi:hypothetical protein
VEAYASTIAIRIAASAHQAEFGFPPVAALAAVLARDISSGAPLARPTAAAAGFLARVGFWLEADPGLGDMMHLHLLEYRADGLRMRSALVAVAKDVRHLEGYLK